MEIKEMKHINKKQKKLIIFAVLFLFFLIISSKSVLADDAGPVITVTPYQHRGTTAQDITITVTDSDGLSTENEYKYYWSTSSTTVEGGEWQEYSTDHTVTTTKTATIRGDFYNGEYNTRYLWIKQVKDTAGNTSTAPNSTDQEWTGNDNVSDSDAPVWTYVSCTTTNSNATKASSSDTVTLTFTGTDIHYRINSLTEENITVYVGGTELTTATKSLSEATSITDGVQYTLTLSNLTENGVLSLVIAANTLEDRMGNQNIETTITPVITVINQTPIDTTTSYIGYYADIDDNGTVDGIIYADLAHDTSGTWNTYNTSNNSAYNTMGAFSYSTTSTTKQYYVKETNHTQVWGTGTSQITADVIAPVDRESTEASRFYVMALSDFTTTSYSTFYWYYSAYGNMDDYSSFTSTAFGAGKENTRKMIARWELGTSSGTIDGTTYTGYGAQNAQDLWGVIKDKYNKGWFVPSREEWSAFAYNIGVLSNYNGSGTNVSSTNSTNTKYYSKLGLGSYYWSSSQCITFGAYCADFYYGGRVYYYYVYSRTYVRLGATF